MKGSWSSLAGARVVVRLAACAWLVCVLAACGGREQQEAERARRARQMRDVSRMLDAMEADTTPAATPPVSTAAPLLPPHPETAIAANDDPSMPLLAILAIAVAGGLVVPALATLAWRRRKRLSISRPNAPSDRPAATDPLPTSASVTHRDQVTLPPAWVYRGSSFDTPPIQVADDPVNLLVAPVAMAPLARTDHWDTCVRQARALPRQDADARLAHAENEVRATLDDADDRARPALLAQWTRVRLARIERFSGATRLFAMRELVAAIEGDPAAADPVAIDARIEAQLAWASWVRGDAAASRLAEAERLCAMLRGDDARCTALALRREGQIFLQRAELVRGRQALADMERAQACFDKAHALLPDAETALLVARTALHRARSLSPADAADACAHALIHAFLAEQETGCRAEALACRLDIQLVYAALAVDDHGHAGVTASLGRDLEAAGPLAPTARLALAEACLREGDPAKAAGLCESIWNDGGAQPRLLNLWRDACHRWSGIEGHDRAALARSLRLLAIARSTL
ncbi:hypothetical protein [Luteibacter sp. SG786]|uniref:hypothetical protein n=1 Tax=Luteibacter sp. SG786 TaxID=2587130 RepID=UPI00142149AF|nr:hypothetical protein [Luteibacter sp. SG786]NII54681.1 tetratricopeptide (TPR) repeat protein [Luteibacter sp. SG786]